MAANVTPSIPGAPSFFSAISYAARSVSILQTCTYKPQKRQDGSAFALTYSLRLRSCSLMGAFIISPLPSVSIQASYAARPLRSTDVTPLHCYYEPSRRPLVVHPFPGWVRLSDVPCFRRFLSRDEDGFSSCSVCPCDRAVSTTPPE